MTVTSLSGIKQNVTVNQETSKIDNLFNPGWLSKFEWTSKQDSLFEVFYGFLVWEKDEKRYAKNEVAVFQL